VSEEGDRWWEGTKEKKRGGNPVLENAERVRRLIDQAVLETHTRGHGDDEVFFFSLVPLLFFLACCSSSMQYSNDCIPLRADFHLSHTN